MILVTGGSGFLGSHIVHRLVESGFPVRVLVRNLERARREGRLEGISIDWVTGDVTEPATLPPAMEGVEAVVHTAAIAIEKGHVTYEEVNHHGTVNIVDSAKEAGVTRFLNVSQLGADPDLPYRFLASKGRAQVHVSQSGMDWTQFRPSVIWGPEDEFANTFARLALVTPILFPIVGDEGSRFQPIWVGDLSAAVVQSIADSATFGEIYELGGPEILTLEEIEARTLEALETSRIMLRFPLPLLRIVVRIMEALLPNPPVTSSLLELLQVSNVTDDNQIQRFNQDPRPFTVENIQYMREFTIKGTLRQYLGRD